MANLLPHVVYSQTPTKLRNVAGTDLLLIAQPWSQGLAGYKTVNITVDNLYRSVMESIKTSGITNFVKVDTENGLTGTGSTTSPLGISVPYLKDNYTRPEFVNASQIGDIEQTGLPIGGSYYSIAYPNDGEGREPVVVESNTGVVTFINPVTNGSEVRYCYGKGRFNPIGASGYTFEQTDQVYKPPLSGAYASPDYFIDSIFAKTETAMLARLKHKDSTSSDRTRDRLLWIDTNGALESAYHQAYFINVSTFYTTDNSGAINPYSAENAFKYGIFEQAGKRYLMHRYTPPGLSTIANANDKGSQIRIYELNVDAADKSKLNATLVTGITSTFLGKTFTPTDNADTVFLNAGHPPKNTDPSAGGYYMRIDDPNDEFTFGGFPSTYRFTFSLQTFLVDGVLVLMHTRALGVMARRLDIQGSWSASDIFAWMYVIDMPNKKITHIVPEGATVSNNVPVATRNGGPLVNFTTTNVSTIMPASPVASTILNPSGLYVVGPSSTTAEMSVYKLTQTPQETAGKVVRFSNNAKFMSRLQGRSPSPTSVDLDVEFWHLDTPKISQSAPYLAMDRTKAISAGVDPVGGILIGAGDIQDTIHYSSDGTQLQGYNLGISRLPKGFTNTETYRGSVTHFNVLSGSIFNGATSGLANTKCTTAFERFKIVNNTEFDSLNVMTAISTKISMTFGDTPNYTETVTTKTLDWVVLRDWLRGKMATYRNAAAAVSLFYFKGKWWGWCEGVMIAPIGGQHQTWRVLCAVSSTDANTYAITAIHDGSTAEPDSTFLETFIDGPNNAAYVGDGSMPRITIFTEEASGAIRIACAGGYWGGGSYITPLRVYSYRCPEPTTTVAMHPSPVGATTQDANWTVDKILGVSLVRNTVWYGIPYTLHPVTFSATGVTSKNTIADIRLLTAPYTSDNFTVKITTRIPFFFSGVNGFIEPQDINLRDWFPIVASRVFYMYLTLEAGEPKIEMLDAITAERVNYTLIATITTDQNKISNIEAYSFMRLSNYRFSITSKGSAIPVSPPTSDLPNFTSWE